MVFKENSLSFQNKFELNKINILHISAASKQTGAGLASTLTHEALIRNGINSRQLFLVGENSSELSTYSYTSNSPMKQFKRFFVTTLDHIPTWIYFSKQKQIFSPGLFGLSLRNTELFKWAKIIHIHWANHGFIDIKEIKLWNKPVVWTIRDMWPFTGGCHHSFDCEKYRSNCGSCPVLGSNKDPDLSSMVLKRKKENLSKLSIQWVAISNSLKNDALQSAVLKDKPISVIFSGIDCDTFNITNIKKARDYFTFPSTIKIILIGAGNIREKYKGFQYVINSLNKLDKNYLIVTFGAGKITQRGIPQKVINMGYISNDKELAQLYNCADIFLAPSIAEAFGKTFAEAQACGLPVVCFNETGPADIIEHLKSGYLAKFKDEKDLLKGLRFCLKTNFNRNYIGQRARKLFDVQQIIKQYITLYQKCIH